MSRFNRAAARALVGAAGVLAGLCAHATDSNLGESSEIAFCNGGVAPYTGCVAADLRTKADALSNPAAIFEYVRNNYDFSAYHGARSGSVNTFLGGRGNDVDLAATLIAMLRASGTPARYGVGTVRARTVLVTNWLQVEDQTLAQSLLIDQGIQGVVASTSGSTPTVDFEHVWVEALVPYGWYRGESAPLVNCATTPDTCHWVPMDPSWKQYKQVSSGLDPYAVLTFDYNAYYSAIVNADVTRVNKNPLEIYQEQVLDWLGTNAPGKTLEDIPDFRGVIPEVTGLLPASLPYAVVSSTTRSYNSVADHDASVPSSESKNWAKRVQLTTTFTYGGSPVKVSAGSAILTDIATERLTLANVTTGGVTQLVTRLGGTTIATPVTVGSSLNGSVVALKDPFSITVTMDGPPDATGGANDEKITATYQAVIGGYYLVATGGETSNWSQAHRAAQQLLAANAQYPTVYNPAESGCIVATGINCTAYVDINGNGAYDAGDTSLMSNAAAMDALSGGLLYVASTQYFASLQADFAAIDRINKIKTPIAGFLGVVSSTYEPAEYIGSTAFGILPSGLLIDMKGIVIEGNWRINAPAASAQSDSQFSLAGHIVSSLEHETWQQLTGYDAISTVRGIQMALASGAALLNPTLNRTTNNMIATYQALGFSYSAAPSGFTYTPFAMPFGANSPATWTSANEGAAFDVLLAQESTATPAAFQARVNYKYNASTGLYGWVHCVYTEAVQLQGYINSGQSNGTFISAYNLCDGTSYGAGDTVIQIYTGLQTDYVSHIIPVDIGQSYFNFFDRAQGFNPAAYVYRATPIAANAQFTSLVQTIRDNLYLQDVTQAWVDYLVPSQQSIGPTFKFAVDLRRVHDTATGNLVGATFEITNTTGIAAGGGFVGNPSVRRPMPVSASKE